MKIIFRKSKSKNDQHFKTEIKFFNKKYLDITTSTLKYNQWLLNLYNGQFRLISITTN